MPSVPASASFVPTCPFDEYKLAISFSLQNKKRVRVTLMLKYASLLFYLNAFIFFPLFTQISALWEKSQMLMWFLRAIYYYIFSSVCSVRSLLHHISNCHKSKIKMIGGFHVHEHWNCRCFKIIQSIREKKTITIIVNKNIK